MSKTFRRSSRMDGNASWKRGNKKHGFSIVTDLRAGFEEDFAYEQHRTAVLKRRAQRRGCRDGIGF